MASNAFLYVDEDFPLRIEGEEVATLNLSCEIEVDGDGAIDEVGYIFLGNMVQGRRPVRVTARHMLYDAIIAEVSRRWSERGITPPEDVRLPPAARAEHGLSAAELV